MIRVKKDQKRSSLDGISQFSEDLENDWVPMSRNQKSRKPINPTSNRSYRKSSRVQDWVNFNIKSLGDITSQDSDSGFEQSTGKSTADYQSLYIEPWTDCHNNADSRINKDKKNNANQGDKVRIFVAGPSPKLERKKSYTSTGPNDERYYVSDKPVTRKDKKKKKKIAPQPPNKRSIGLQTENRNNNDNNYVSMNLHQQSKKTYLFSTSSNEMAFPNSMPAQMMNRRNEASLDNLCSASTMKTTAANNPDIPEPDYSPIIIRKSKKQPKSKRNNMNLWGNAARYRGSLEELDQEEVSPDESQGSSSAAYKVRNMAEKLKVQAERDRRRQLQRGSSGSSSSDHHHAKEFQSLRPMKSSDGNHSSRMSRRSVSEERDHDSVLSDSFSMLSMSNSNIPVHHHRMSQYSPRSWNHSSSRSNSSLPGLPMDEPVSMVPSSHEQSVLNEVKSKQSQFFNSLFPSRANRFGFPVYPERTFGIPSNMSVPVSFAGFSPEPSGAQQHQSMLYFNSGEGVEPSESSSILSELPKLFMGRKKKYNVKKSRSGLFGLF